MTALLVDDNRLVINALKLKIDWQSLGVSEIHTASNITQAQQIFTNHSIDIMVCDIEMPQGSGLELLAWMRDEGHRTQTIFLTNYADFNYAQKAIELQSFDYFLKPIAFDKLTIILHKAIAKVLEDQNRLQTFEQEVQYQLNNALTARDFWENLVLGKSFPSDSSIAKSLQTAHLPYTMDQLFLPTLIQVRSEELLSSPEDKVVFTYGIENVIHELFISSQFTIETLSNIDDNCWYLILKPNDSTVSQDISICCDAMIRQCDRYLHYDVCCFIGNSCTLSQLQPILHKLREMRDNFINCHYQTLLLSDYHETATPYIPPNLSELEQMLLLSNHKAFSSCLLEYLEQMELQNSLNTHTLQLLRVDVMQLIYAIARQKDIPAHQLFPDQNSDPLYEQSLRSTEQMYRYLTANASKIVNCQEPSKPTNLTEQVKQYISQNLESDLSRNSLAEHFFLNSDYLARIFTKQEGISLGNYIMQTRVGQAKILLKNTELNINTIAARVGYTNYSHFSRIFRELSGFSPIEYRKNKI